MTIDRTLTHPAAASSADHPAPRGVEPDRPYVEVEETHSGAVVMVGDLAYKFKKPVDLGFLDFSTIESRRRACAREVELNRRLSPDVYLGVGQLRAPARPPEPVVVMRRMPPERRLSALVRQSPAGDGDAAVLRSLARRVAVFHAAARRGPRISREGTRAALRARWKASFEQCRGLGPGAIPAQTLDAVQRAVGTFLDGREPLFADRVAESRILDGHGDLIAEDVFCLEDGPRILDCLEFDDRLRYVDQLDDIAFLAMDLEHLGAPEAASSVLTAYLEFSGDPAPPALVHHFIAYRAFVRAKVMAFRASQSGGIPPAALQARRFAAQTLRHLAESEVRLVLVGGPPGSGKTTLSGHLADRLGLVVLGSDRTRKELAGLAPQASAADGFEQGLYTRDWSDRTYAELLRRAELLLGRGESVVIDASWSEAGRRRAARRLAARTSAGLVEIRCQLDPATSEARIRTRTGVSDADPEIAGLLREREEPWPEADALDTSEAPDALAERACALVRPVACDVRTGSPRPRPRMVPD